MPPVGYTSQPVLTCCLTAGVGILEVFIMPYVLPVFRFQVVCFYLLMMYYTLIDRDFMQGRFLFAPVSLAYPWVGLGMERMFNYLKSSSMPKVYFAIFIVIFFMSPVFKCVYSVAKADNVLRKSGKWLAANEMFHDAKLLTNDIRSPFFAGIKIDKYFKYSGEKDKYNFASMEKFALEKKVDILVIKVSSKETELLDNISYYKKLKKFAGKSRDVYIYCSPAFCGHGR